MGTSRKANHQMKSIANSTPQTLVPALPHVAIIWTEKELECLAKLICSAPAKPTKVLVRGLRSDVINR